MEFKSVRDADILQVKLPAQFEPQGNDDSVCKRLVAKQFVKTQRWIFLVQHFNISTYNDIEFKVSQLNLWSHLTDK